MWKTWIGPIGNVSIYCLSFCLQAHPYFISFLHLLYNGHLLWDRMILTHKALLHTFEVHPTIFEYDRSLGIVRHYAYNMPFSRTSNIMFPNSVCPMHIHIWHTIVHIKEFTNDCFEVAMLQEFTDVNISFFLSWFTEIERYIKNSPMLKDILTSRMR